MNGDERLLAWFDEALARHQPHEVVSLLEAQARFIAVLIGLIAVERGAGMVFGWILSGERADALRRAALLALTEAVRAWRAHLERHHGASAMGQDQQLVPFAGLPGHMLRKERELERGVEHEYVESLYLAFRAGTAEVHLTDTSYRAPPRLLAADLVSFLHALRGAAPQVDDVLAALAKGFSSRGPSAG